MTLFDEIVLSKRNRGRTSIFSGRSTTDFLSDTSNHIWRTANATFFPPSSRSQQNISSDYGRGVRTRGTQRSNTQSDSPTDNLPAAPANLDPSLMTEPRMIHGAPRVSKTANIARRKPLPKLMNGLAVSPPS